MKQPTVVIFQYRLLHYRLSLFERLRDVCASRGIRLELVAGQATRREATRRDEGHLSWARTVTNRVWEVGSRDWIYQPIPADLRDAELVILMQENRLLGNYLLMLRRALGGRTKVAYWGHGRNFQSAAPTGVRERWKRFLMCRVDWWFAYTEVSANIVREAGYPAERLTVLNNAIDNTGFEADLASVSDDEVKRLRQRVGAEPDAMLGLYCGSLYPDKRLPLLMQAARQIACHRPDFRLVVVGDGPSRHELDAAKGEPWIHWVGVQRGRAKAAWFKAAQLYLSPGAVGLHVLDSFVSGTPMITTDDALHGPEIAYLRNDVNGLVTPATAKDYADAVLALIGDQERYRRMRLTAMADAARYTLDEMVSRFTAGIVECVSRPRR